MNRMKQNELQGRLQDFLPMFILTRRKGLSRTDQLIDQVCGLAAFLGREDEEVWRWYETRNGRGGKDLDPLMPADDYWRMVVEWVRRKSTGYEGFLVYDQNGQVTYTTRALWQAEFLSTVDGHHVWRPKIPTRPIHVSAEMDRRSRLRRLVHGGILSKEEICGVFEFDQHTLVDYQLEGVWWLSTPDETRLRKLERMAAMRVQRAA